jgi:hypothetical protein
MSFLFGSKGKAPETKFTTMSTLNPGQQQLQQQLEQLLQGQLGSGVPSYPGTYTPGPSGTQNQMFDLVSQLLQGEAPMQQEGMGFLTDLMQPYSDTKARNYWDAAVKAPMMESWEKDIVPGIMEQFAAYDAAGSGPAQKAVAESGRRLDTDMGGLLAKTLLDYENQYKTRGLDASKAGLAYPETLLSSVLGPANMQRQITGEQLMEGYQDWLYEQPYNNPWLKLLNPTLDRRTFENMAYQTGGQAPQKGIFGDLLGGVVSAAGSILGSPAGSKWLFG